MIIQDGPYTMENAIRCPTSRASCGSQRRVFGIMLSMRSDISVSLSLAMRPTSWYMIPMKPRYQMTAAKLVLSLMMEFLTTSFHCCSVFEVKGYSCTLLGIGSDVPLLLTLAIAVSI